MHVGLCTISNREAPIEIVLEAAAEAGYDGVEPWGRGHVGDGDLSICRSVRRTADKLGLAVPAYSSYLRAGREDFDERVEDEVAVADALGAMRIRVWAGAQEYGNHDREHWEHTVSDFRTVTDLATDRGIEVTVEKHEGTLTNTGEGARRLIKVVDRLGCGLNYQPMFGMAPDAISAEARVLAELSNHVHLQAVPTQGNLPRCALADAFFDVEGIVSALGDAGFDGYIDIEFVRPDVPYKSAICADLAYLRSIAV